MRHEENKKTENNKQSITQVQDNFKQPNRGAGVVPKRGGGTEKNTGWWPK